MAAAYKAPDRRRARGQRAPAHGRARHGGRAAGEPRRHVRGDRAILADGPVVVTHGNGPQVGNELLRQELAAAEAPPLPLYLAVAQTQAEIGALVAAELGASPGGAWSSSSPAWSSTRTTPPSPTRRSRSALLRRERARELEQERGWSVREDAGRGWRRVVPRRARSRSSSSRAIRTLLESGAVVAVGGGGIPRRRPDGRRRVDAVIDKDHASALLAIELGARDPRHPDTGARGLPRLRNGRARRGRGARGRPRRGAPRRLPAGSMRPKVEAAFAFVRPGRRGADHERGRPGTARPGRRLVPASKGAFGATPLGASRCLDRPFSPDPIWIRRGFSSSGLGTRISSTPSRYSALIPSRHALRQRDAARSCRSAARSGRTGRPTAPRARALAAHGERSRRARPRSCPRRCRAGRKRDELVLRLPDVDRGQITPRGPRRCPGPAEPSGFIQRPISF